tara:strand:+ start:29909 stop:31687 length:1779 start_codon:yes stop_codon:yes gene_type:complete
MNNNYKKYLITINDFIIVIISTFLAYIIRFEDFEIVFSISIFNFILPTLIYFILFIRYSIYNQVVRFFFINQINLYFKLNFIYLLISIAIYPLFYGYFPRSISAIQPIVFMQLFFISRIIAFYLINILSKKNKLKCFLIGVNKESLSFINNASQEDYVITHIFEKNKDLINRNLNTIKVSDIKFLDFFVKQKSPDIIISIVDDKFLFKQSTKVVIKHDLRMKKITTTNKNHLYLNNYEFEEVTLDELFQTNILNKNFNNNFKNKNIIITGAGGSIGKELSRQLSNQNVKNLYLLEKDEYSLFKIHQELSLKKNLKVHRVLIDLKDFELLHKIFKNISIDFIFHAAAYKHVGIVEENYVSGIYNNLIVTDNILKLNNEKKVKNFVLVSSDKSVRPTNLMGASKRVCELLMYKYKYSSKNRFNYSIVRFGNVINSTGSVLPIFKKQIENKKPLTITHKNVSRYFMSIPQAVNLVLHSSIITNGLKIYLLDMGKPIKILELAKKLLKVNGLLKNENKIKFIGLGKGEKIEEELYKDFNFIKTTNKQINESLETSPDINKINTLYRSILDALKKDDLNKLKKLLNNKMVSYEEQDY